MPRVTLARDHPSPRLPIRLSGGRRTSSRKTSLKVWVPVMSTRGRTVHPRGVHRADEVGDALVHGRVRLGAGQQDPELGAVGVGRPHLLAPDHPLVAVEVGPGGQRGQVGAGAGLAEQLAPDLLAGQQRAAGTGPSARRCRRRGWWARPTRSRWCWWAGAPRPAGARRPRSAGGWDRRRAPTAAASGGRPGPRSASCAADGAAVRRPSQRAHRTVRRGSSVGRQREVHAGQRRLGARG